jgi:hypothetical protein
LRFYRSLNLAAKTERRVGCNGGIDLDMKIILRRVFTKWDVGVWTLSSWFRIGTGGGHL